LSMYGMISSHLPPPDYSLTYALAVKSTKLLSLLSATILDKFLSLEEEKELDSALKKKE